MMYHYVFLYKMSFHLIGGDDDELLNSITEFTDGISLPLWDQRLLMDKYEVDELDTETDPMFTFPYSMSDRYGIEADIKAKGLCTFEDYWHFPQYALASKCESNVVKANRGEIPLRPEYFEAASAPFNTELVKRLEKYGKKMYQTMIGTSYTEITQHLRLIEEDHRYAAFLKYTMFGFPKYKIIQAIESKFPPVKDKKNHNASTVPRDIWPEAPGSKENKYLPMGYDNPKVYFEEIYRRIFDTRRFLDWDTICQNPEAYHVDAETLRRWVKLKTGVNIPVNASQRDICFRLRELKEELSQMAPAIIYQPGSRWVEESTGMASAYGPEAVSKRMIDIKNLCSETQLQATSIIDLLQYVHDLDIKLVRPLKTYTKQELCSVIQKHLQLLGE